MEKTQQTVEQQTAQTILQQPFEVKVGEKTYAVAQPSIATLVLASAAVSRLPHIKLDPGQVMTETLSVAKDCKGICEILAILILGAKHVDDMVTRKVKVQRRRLWGLWKQERTVEMTTTAKDALQRELMLEMTPRDVQNTMAKILSSMQVADFFGITTFLLEINMLRPTKVGSQTASGQ